MMDVQVMRQVVDVVEQGVMPRVAQEAASRWGGQASADSLAYVRSSANHIFRFSQAGEPRYLRLAPATRRSRAALDAELAFIQHVGQSGLAVARPIPSGNAALVEEVTDGQTRYLATVVTGLRGDQFEADELDEARYRTWGRALAALHRASQTFPPHPARPRWPDEMRAALRAHPPDETAIARVLTAGLAWLDTLPTDPTDPTDAREYGLLHGDFELDNLVWNDGGQIQVLDFDDAMYAPYALDIAIALQDVWETPGEHAEQRTVWFADGYAEVRPLPANFRETLPRFLALLSATKVARVLQAYATTPTTGEGAYPAWLEQMRSRHQGWLARQRAGLIWP